MDHTAENVAIVTSKTAAYGGAAGAVIGGLKLNEIGVIVGIVVGVLGLVLGQFWSWRRDRREQTETAARIKALEEEA